MRDNFVKGIYPSLNQRREFALSLCDFVRNNVHENSAAIISFSFVNTDLRDIFRYHFPMAVWALVDVQEDIAAERIRTRKGHFYKGAPVGSRVNGEVNIDSQGKEVSKQLNDPDNKDWTFASVEYPHIVLDGLDPIETNALKIFYALQPR
mmetsp:Transcript_49051/g.147731  ORF Transcript_49051/g.147731 Transcript_49051/m.147731 type:complete len:150 (+) Transcript_49051:306-755(+)